MYRISGRLLIAALLFLALTAADGVFVFLYSANTKNDSAAINALGTIRGSIQRASKMELAGIDSAAVRRTVDDTIIRCMRGTNFDFSSRAKVAVKLTELELIWNKLTAAFAAHRSGDAGARRTIVSLSEECWRIADESVFALEHASDESKQLLTYTMLLITLNIVLLSGIIWQLKAFVVNKLEYFANYDSLTGAINRIAFENILAQEIMKLKRYRRPLSLIMFDVDHFKRINDTHGHRAGDSVLKLLSKIVKNHIRATDTFARVGGEEFMILLPETAVAHACTFADKLRKIIETEFVGGHYRITASFGVTACRKSDEKQDIMGRADAAMYRAKRAGRNRYKKL